MDLSSFNRSLSDSGPPDRLGPALAALWWAKNNDWERAHGIVMADESAEAAWVHAYLHRVEGDLGNAGYWYRWARRAPAIGDLDAEWHAMVAELLNG
jgi:hypothetical protein